MLTTLIRDAELQARVRLGERFVLRFRRPANREPRKWSGLSIEDRELCVDLCMPVTRHKEVTRGGVTLKLVKPKDTADPTAVLWSYGCGKLSDEHMTVLRQAAERMGWGVDDWVLRMGEER